MKLNWDEGEASQYEGEIGQLTYACRLLEREESFGVYGGGYASMKTTTRNLLGEAEEVTYVVHGRQLPGAGQAAGLTALRCKPLTGLVSIENLTQAQLANELACSRTNAVDPIPPVDALLHATLPYKVIFFTQPDEVLAAACMPAGSERLKQIFAGTLLVLPYASAGLPLAKACSEALNHNSNPDIIGIFVEHQGLLTFGQTVKQAWDRLMLLDSQAEEYLKQHQAWHLEVPPAEPGSRILRQELAALRKAVSDAAGLPLILTVNPHPAVLSLSRREDIMSLARQGPATARDASLLRHLPMIGRDVETYQVQCEQAMREYAGGQKLEGIDCAPRVILDPDFGLCALGGTAAEAVLAGQRALHWIDIILHATALEKYQSLGLNDTIAAESLAATRTQTGGGDSSQLFNGEVALVTGGASGIGKACVESLLARGAAVASMDINPKVKTLYDRPDYLGLECDLTNEDAVLAAFDALVNQFGGLDMLVLNAGIFPAGVRIEALSLTEWQRVMHINLDSNLVVMREAYPLLKNAPLSGRVLAAVTQLARIAALEWGKDHIRVNLIHPDAIFDTGIWSEEVLKSRAAHYGLTVQQYKTRNVLGVELNSHYVGELVAEMLGPRFEKITGAQIPVDGGSDRVI
jgi:rhamnose utilization protein RhaD (predicted bifunctional aldolase and dehydrogenase)/NAD(P)-dependent dehydrogenase (short-subunit alcohol dehydrogenase family)